jgi:hypothetical protein
MTSVPYLFLYLNITTFGTCLNSTLKIETACSSETVLQTYQNVRWHSLEVQGVTVKAKFSYGTETKMSVLRE